MRVICFFSYDNSNLVYLGGQRETIEKARRWQEEGIEVHMVQTKLGVKFCESFGFFPVNHIYIPFRSKNSEIYPVER